SALQSMKPPSPNTRFVPSPSVIASPTAPPKTTFEPSPVVIESTPPTPSSIVSTPPSVTCSAPNRYGFASPAVPAPIPLSPRTRPARPDRVALGAAEHHARPVTGLDRVDAADRIRDREHPAQRQLQRAELVVVVARRMDLTAIAQDHTRPDTRRHRVVVGARNHQVGAVAERD